MLKHQKDLSSSVYINTRDIKVNKAKTTLTRLVKWLAWYYNQTISLLQHSTDVYLLLKIITNVNLPSINTWVVNSTSVQNGCEKPHLWLNPVLRLKSHQHLPDTTVKGSHLNYSDDNFKWFREYWMLHQSKVNFQFSTHRDFKTMFFTCVDRSGVYNIIGISKFYARWKNAHNLLLNLTFFNSHLMAFSNKLFVEESLVFNWKLSSMDYRFFKYSQPLLHLKDSPYGDDTRRFFQYWNRTPLDAAVITDIKSHEKNVFFLTRSNVYTFGLIPANYRPWRISFPIPLLADSVLGQYYFCRSIIRVSYLGQALRFDQIRNRWFRLNLECRLATSFFTTLSK